MLSNCYYYMSTTAKPMAALDLRSDAIIFKRHQDAGENGDRVAQRGGGAQRSCGSSVGVTGENLCGPVITWMCD